ncbi:MAG: hypothetical protein LQ344_000464 [Seirophora lacunosa]|nr:MAG: hypothetical protein LQ344_000464 [Seirophora lacunosa]
MDERATIVPVPPRQNPTTSYWQDPPSSLATHRTTSELPAAASAVIIGSGVTGASIAYKLLDRCPESSVLLLEARTACSGATGRNGGHTKAASYRAFLDNVATLGEDEAAKIVRLEHSCIKAVHAFAREHSINCGSWEGDTVDVIFDESQWTRAKKSIAEIRRVLGHDHPAALYSLHDSNETKEKFLVGGALGSVSYAAGSISAYQFVVGMLELALKKGLNLQTETLVTGLKRSETDPERWLVETVRGSVRAKRVILATNGYTANLYPPARGIIVPLRGTVAAQRPGNGLPEQGLKTTYSFIYGSGYEYMIFRPVGSTFAGDLVIGGCSTKAPQEGLQEWGTTDDTSMDPQIGQYVRDSAAQYFGSQWGADHPDGRIRRQWTGIMGYSSQGFPFVGLVPHEEDLWIAASFQGLGMVLCFHTAEALVTMMEDEDDVALNEWFPSAFRMSEDRLKHKFRGRLHEESPMNLEDRSQL